jgi:hypothetical protein
MKLFGKSEVSCLPAAEGRVVASLTGTSDHSFQQATTSEVNDCKSSAWNVEV